MENNIEDKGYMGLNYMAMYIISYIFTIIVRGDLINFYVLVLGLCMSIGLSVKVRNKYIFYISSLLVLGLSVYLN